MFEDRKDGQERDRRQSHALGHAPELELTALFEQYALLKRQTLLNRDGLATILKQFRAYIENHLFGHQTDEHNVVSLGSGVAVHVDFRACCIDPSLRPCFLIICRMAEERSSDRPQGNTSGYSLGRIVLPCLSELGAAPIEVGPEAASCAIMFEAPAKVDQEAVEPGDVVDEGNAPRITLMIPGPLVRGVIDRFLEHNFREVVGDLLRCRIEQSFGGTVEFDRVLEGANGSSEKVARLLLHDSSGREYLAELGPGYTTVNGQPIELQTLTTRFVVPVGDRYPALHQVQRLLNVRTQELLKLQTADAGITPDVLNPQNDGATLVLGVENWARTRLSCEITYPAYRGAPMSQSLMGEEESRRRQRPDPGRAAIDESVREKLRDYLFSLSLLRDPEAVVDWYLRASKPAPECEWYLVTVRPRGPDGRATGPFVVSAEGETDTMDDSFCGYWIQRSMIDTKERFELVARVLPDHVVEKNVRALVKSEDRKESIFFAPFMKALVRELTFDLARSDKRLDRPEDFPLDKVGVASIYHDGDGEVYHLVLCSHRHGHSLLNIRRSLDCGIVYASPGTETLDLFRPR